MSTPWKGNATEKIKYIEDSSKEFESVMENILKLLSKPSEKPKPTLLQEKWNNTKIYTWDNKSSKINVYDTITMVKESFNVEISFVN